MREKNVSRMKKMMAFVATAILVFSVLTVGASEFVSAEDDEITTNTEDDEVGLASTNGGVGADIPGWTGPTEEIDVVVSTEDELRENVSDGETEVIGIDSDIPITENNNPISIQDVGETIVSATDTRQRVENNTAEVSSIFDIKADGVTIKGLNITNSEEYGNKGIRLQDIRADVAIEDNIITNCWEPIIFNSATTNHDNITIANNDISGGYIGIMAFTVDNSTIQNNYIHDISNWGIQISIYNTSKVSGQSVPTNNVIKNNRIEEITAVGAGNIFLQAKNTTIEHNNITDDCYVGILLTEAIAEYNTGTLDVSGSEVHYNTIVGHSGNRVWTIKNFQDNLTAGTEIDATHNWWGTSTESEIQENISDNVDYLPWYLDEAMTELSPYAYNVDQDTYHATIQKAIDNATTEDTIEVGEGTYEESVEIDVANLTLTGAGEDQTFVKNTAGSPVITVSVDDVTIQDLEITDDAELVEGIRVVSGASENLTVEDVDFMDIGHPTGSNSYGIRFMVSFANLSVNDCDFVPVTHTSYNRTMGIYAGNSLQLSNFDITHSSFEGIWTGIYLRSTINGLYAEGNLFGQVQSSDLKSCVSGIYIGDGDDDNFDIENITVYDNTFTDYGRGFYILNYANNTVVRNVEIYENTFTNSIHNAGVRFIGGLTGDEEITFDAIAVYNNTFTQDSDVSYVDPVGLIIFRSMTDKMQSSQIAVTDNDITFSGASYTYPMYGILLRMDDGPFGSSVAIEGNDLDGGNTGGTDHPVVSSGILVMHYRSTNWPSEIFEMDVAHNNITAFDNGVSIYDADDDVYGNLTTGSTVNINYNNIYGNALYGVRNDNAQTLDATYNYWGHETGPYHPDKNPDGEGDNVSGNVSFVPWYLDEAMTELGPVYNVDQDTYHATIQEAIDAAGGGDTIEVSEGTYEESLNVDVENLTLESVAGPEETTIDADDHVIIVEADGVTIKGFEIVGRNDQDPSTYDKGIKLTGTRQNVTIDNNIIRGTYEPIILNSAAPTNHENIVIKNNNLSGEMIGIMAFTVSNSIIENNYIHDIDVGIQMSIYTNDTASTPSNNIIRNNEFENLVAENNEPDDDMWYYGLLLQARDTTVTENEFIGGGEFGVLVTDSITAYGTGDRDISGNEIHHNNIYGHSRAGVIETEDYYVNLNKSGYDVNAAYNYWGHETGPYHPDKNPDGQGDNVTNNVTFEPWLDDMYPDGEPRPIDRVVITPGSDQTITAGETIDFDAEAYDENDKLINDVDADFIWENATDGLFDETTAGDYNVWADYEGVTSSTVTVTVEAAAVDSVVITPETDQTITAGDTIDFSAEAYDEYDNLITDDDTAFTWENTDNTGLFDETTAGDYDVTATYDGVSSPITTVTVEAAGVDYVEITPDTDQTITAGETIDFDAEAYDAYDNLITDDDTAFTWVNTDDTGLFDETTAGDYNVTATYNGVTSAEIIVTVEEPANFEVEITDYDDNVTVGDTVTVQFTVENTGDIEDTQTIYFNIDGAEEDSMEITLSGGDNYSGEFTWNAEDSGEHDLEVTSDDTSDLVTITVEEEEEEEAPVPGFTTMLLVLASVIAVAIYYNKKEQ